jgi:hypothetical protein
MIRLIVLIAVVAAATIICLDYATDVQANASRTTASALSTRMNQAGL